MPLSRIPAAAAVAFLVLLHTLPLRADDAAAGEPRSATVLNIDGSAQIYEDDAWKDLEVGELCGEGDRVRTGAASGLHLVLPDGSSFVLGENSEASLSLMGGGEEGSKTLLELAKGLMNTMVEKLKPGSSFEIHAGESVAAVKGTDFQVENQEGAGPAVTVKEGEVHFGDAGLQHFVPVHPGQLSRFTRQGARAPRALRAREAQAFERRWAKAHVAHAGRHEALQRLRQSWAPRRAASIQRLKARQQRRAKFLKKAAEDGPAKKKKKILRRRR